MARTPTTPRLHAIEHVDKEAVQDVQHFIVVLIDGHLQIQAGEFTQVAVGERLLSPAQVTKEYYTPFVSYWTSSGCIYTMQAS